MKITFEQPVEIGQTIYERGQKQFAYNTYVVKNLKFTFAAKGKEAMWEFAYTDENNNLVWKVWDYKIHFTYKEELFETFRKEIKEMLPKEVISYLWPDDYDYFYSDEELW